MHPHRGSSRHLDVRLIGVIGALALAGCKSTEHSDQPPSSPSSTSSRNTKSTAGEPGLDDPKVQAQIEQKFIVGPAAARDINYRVAWQYSEAGQPIRRCDVEGDSVFTLDDRNILTRLRVDDGSKLWKAAATKPIEEIQGLNYINDRVYLANGGSLLVFDANTGAQIDRQQLQKIANTQPLRYERYLLFGSRDGQVIWHAFEVEFQWRGFQVAKSIQVPLLLADRNVVVAVGSDGTIMALNPANTGMFWSKRLLSPVIAQPAAGNGVLYVAGQDQYIHALDLGNGRTLWRTLFDTPLSQSPTLIGDRVYQQVPSQGLVSFEAQPADTPGGKIIWKAPDVHGNVILQRRNDLFAWDAAARTLQIVDKAHGSVVTTLKLPKVKFLIVPGGPDSKTGDIFAAGDDGRVVRLVPRT